MSSVRAVLILTVSVLCASLAFSNGSTVDHGSALNESEIKEPIDKILDGSATGAELEEFFETHKEEDEQDGDAFLDEIENVPASVTIVSS